MTSDPDVTGFFDEATNSVSYVVSDPATGTSAIVDSVLDYDSASGHTATQSAGKLVAHIQDNGLKLDWILETHVHADHLSAAPYIQEKLGGKLAIGENIRIVQDTFGKIFNAGTGFQRDGSQFDRLFKDGDTFMLGSIPARIMHTPGHTPACLTYVIGDAAFIGDTLFMPDYGTARADFPGGDARQLYRSIRRIYALPPETRLFLCHDYKPPGRENFVWETTVAVERAHNVHVRDGITEDEFVAMRTARDKTLGAPKLIIPSIQVNMNAGHFPEPDAQGNVYLKVPVNRI
ncbi:MAG: MBL fold metallo-hydrolase [Aestuariivirga sp.]